MEIERAIQNLDKRGYAVSHFATRQAAADYLVSRIKGTTVGIGGSQTIKELDIYQRLSEDNTVYWHWITPGDETTRAAAAACVYLTSANAVSETGEIVNIDGKGNRVAATLYDKDTVYIIVGTNKFEADLDGAVRRARNVAAPKNALRFGGKTPCAADGKCHDCSSPDRICRGMVIIMGNMLGNGRTEIIIIDEALGY